MKIVLEMFFVKIEGGEIRYKRYLEDITKHSSDPDEIVVGVIGKEFGESFTRRKEALKCVTHSTSWRYNDGAVMLTYLVLSDELDFGEKEVRKIEVGKLDFNCCANPPRSAEHDDIVEEAVIAHGIRHLGFLIQTDTNGVYKTVVGPSNLEIFKQIHIGVGGKMSAGQ